MRTALPSAPSFQVPAGGEEPWEGRLCVPGPLPFPLWMLMFFLEGDHRWGRGALLRPRTGQTPAYH